MNLTEDGDPAHGCEMCDGEDECTCPKWLPPAPGSEVVAHVDNRGGLTGPDYALVVLRNGVTLEIGDAGLNVYNSREDFESGRLSRQSLCFDPQNEQSSHGTPLADSSGSAVCACVHPDAFECARIRDGRHARDDDDYHRRACECCCHNDEDYDDED